VPKSAGEAKLAWAMRWSIMMGCTTLCCWLFADGVTVPGSKLRDCSAITT
jgi:hypothetical protein